MFLFTDGSVGSCVVCATFDWIALLSVSLHVLLSVLIKMSALVWLLHFSTALTLHLHGGREGSCRCTLCRRAVLDFTLKQQISVNISLSFILYQHTIFIYSCTGFGSVSTALRIAQPQRNCIWLLFLRRLSLLCLNLGESLVPEPPN